MKKLTMLSLLGLMVLALAVAPTQANFVQCPAAGGGCSTPEGTTIFADLINGSIVDDIIEAGLGSDFALGNAGNDLIAGDGDDDILFGGLDNDDLFGNLGNDILMPGPDSGPIGTAIQTSNHGSGNDITNVFAGEITGCLIIEDDDGSDIVNLIGFGPYSAIAPFGDPDLGNEWVIQFDPITGGVIAIEVDGTSDAGVEFINGLTTANPEIIPSVETIGACVVQ